MSTAPAPTGYKSNQVRAMWEVIRLWAENRELPDHAIHNMKELLDGINPILPASLRRPPKSLADEESRFSEDYVQPTTEWLTNPLRERLLNHYGRYSNKLAPTFDEFMHNVLVVVLLAMNGFCAHSRYYETIKGVVAALQAVEVIVSESS